MFGFFSGSSDVEFISDGAIFAKLRELLVAAHEDVLLIAPYVEPNEDLIRVLRDLERRGTNVEIWFREDKTSKYTSEHWFKELTAAGVEFRAVKNLHSKLYVIDNRCIVTSMNLTNASWNNSREFGCVVDLDGKYGDQLAQYVESLDSESIEVQAGKARNAKTRHWKSKPTGSRSSPRKAGFCIRCASQIPLNAERPYCADDYGKWAEYGNRDFKDKFCHSCGSSAPSTMNKPLCRECFKAA